MTGIGTLMVLTAGLALAEAPKEDVAKKEKARLAGTWVIVSVEADGRKLPAEGLKDVRYVFTGAKMTRKRGGKVESEAGYRLDPSKTPKWIDALGPEGEKRKAVPGLYALEGDTLRLCFRTDYKKAGQVREGVLKRPEKLDGGEGSGQVLMALKREKP